MAEPLSAILGILKSSWQAIEFARSTFNARQDAKLLYQKVRQLYALVEQIESAIHEHEEPLNKDIVASIQNALEASNRTLDELARRCHRIGHKESLNVFTRVPVSISYTLSAASIQKFEQQVQTSFISMQLALCLLDRGESRVLNRRISELLIAMETSVDRTTHPVPSPHGGTATNHDFPFAIADRIELHTEIATNITEDPHSSPTFSVRTWSVSTDELSGSPMELLTSQETRAWGEVRRTSESSSARLRKSGTVESTSLIAAIHEQSLQKFQQLLDEGVRITGTDDKGFTPLMHTICQHGNSCSSCLHYMHKLLQLQCDVDANVDGITALHMAVRYDSLDAVSALLEKGAYIDASSPATPLLLAVKHNRAEIVDYLVSNGADIHVSDGSRWGLIHHAVWRKSTKALLALLNKSKTKNLGTYLDQRNDISWTPLMILAERAQIPKDVILARILLDNGADINAVDGSGNSALYYALKLHAVSQQRQNFVRFLVEERKADTHLLQAKVLKQAMGLYPALKTRRET